LEKNLNSKFKLLKANINNHFWHSIFSQDFFDFRVQITKNMNNSGNGPPSDRYTGDVKMNGQRNGKGFAK
jgi:hypothetical protein